MMKKTTPRNNIIESTSFLFYDGNRLQCANKQQSKCNVMVAMTSSQIVCDGNRAQFANRNQQQSEHKVMATRTNLQIETNMK